MDPVALLAALSVMGAIILGLIGVYRATTVPRLAMDRRLGGLMSEQIGEQVVSSGFEGLREKHTGQMPLMRKFLESRSWTDDIALAMDRGDLKLSVSEFVAIRLLLSFTGLAFGMLIVGGLFGLLVAAVLAFLGYTLPGLYLRVRTAGRLKRLNGQLPDALSMVSNSLKSGFGLMQSLELVSKELSHPISTDIRRMLQEVNVGSATDVALRNMADRSGSADLDIVITAMLIQQSTGGNLAEILDSVEHTMRERVRIRGEIKTLTTQGLLTGFIIGGLPVFLGLLFTLINPGYTELLFTELLGNLLLAAAIVLELMGVFLIQKILTIEV
jgi:tight adherence protein B